MKIGEIEIENGLIFPAVAGYSDVGLRVLARRYGAGLAVCEMVSAKGLVYKNANTTLLLKVSEDEPSPHAAQLFGSDPAALAEAVESEALAPFDLVDFNCGCPVHKIVSNGEGSALMKNPALLNDCVRSMTRAAGGKKTITVKMRLGFGMGEFQAPECARAAQEGGAKAVTVHGRVQAQFYAGEVDYEKIARVKESVEIPVIGNGDVRDRESYKRMLETGVDGVAIARGALGKPWVFEEVRGIERKHDVATCFLEHFERLCRVLPERVAVANMKKQAAAYAAGLKGGKAWKVCAFEAKNAEELRESVERIRES